MKQTLFNNLKNLRGWTTDRKIVVFSVDDYGNVRLDSRQARENMDKAGLKVHSRFDAFDALETREDLEMLFENLTSVRDRNGRPAVFTPFAVPCNIDFEAMAVDNCSGYRYEMLPTTFEKLSARQPEAYEGAWALWQEGVEKGLLAPQFHGREHFNLKVFEEKLAARDHEVMTCLENRSYSSISKSGYPTIGYTAAFSFDDSADHELFDEIIRTGANAFEKTFGYRSIYFTPPGGGEHARLHPVLKDAGFDFVNEAFLKSEHQGGGRFKKRLNWTGKELFGGTKAIVRNVVFEPAAEGERDSVGYALKQIETSFRWRKIAHVSSHRVNFCGHISPQNRKHGVERLGALLRAIISRWPDVEFMSARDFISVFESS